MRNVPSLLHSWAPDPDSAQPTAGGSASLHICRKNRDTQRGPSCWSPPRGVDCASVALGSPAGGGRLGSQVSPSLTILAHRLDSPLSGTLTRFTHQTHPPRPEARIHVREISVRPQGGRRQNDARAPSSVPQILQDRGRPSTCAGGGTDPADATAMPDGCLPHGTTEASRGSALPTASVARSHARAPRQGPTPRPRPCDHGTEPWSDRHSPGLPFGSFLRSRDRLQEGLSGSPVAPAGGDHKPTGGKQHEHVPSVRHSRPRGAESGVWAAGSGQRLRGGADLSPPLVSGGRGSWTLPARPSQLHGHIVSPGRTLGPPGPSPTTPHFQVLNHTNTFRPREVTQSRSLGSMMWTSLGEPPFSQPREQDLQARPPEGPAHTRGSVRVLPTAPGRRWSHAATTGQPAPGGAAWASGPARDPSGSWKLPFSSEVGASEAGETPGLRTPSTERERAAGPVPWPRGSVS